MDALAFPQTFIDSVMKLHIADGGRGQYGMRSVPAGAFAGGETLVFDVAWSVFKAGYLVLSARPAKDRKLIKLSGKTMTSNFISAFYKARDHAISWVDASGMYPHFFEQHVREGNKYKKDSYIVYDNKGEKLFRKWGSEPEEFESPAFTHDFVSIIYYTRSIPLNPGDEFSLNMFTAPKTHPVKFKVLPKRETVKSGAGTFNCVRVELIVGGDGKAFSKKDKIEVWVSDDEHKYPVQVKSKAKIGSLNAKLVNVLK
jgi:hypothetical protein